MHIGKQRCSALITATVLLSSCDYTISEKKTHTTQVVITPAAGSVAPPPPVVAVQEQEADTIASLNIDDQTPINVLSISKKVTPDDDEFSQPCEKWTLDSSQVVQVTRMLEPISGEIWHHLYYDLPCTIEGDISINNKTYTYTINAGGFMFIYDDANQYILGCPGKKCAAFFITIEDRFDE